MSFTQNRIMDCVAAISGILFCLAFAPFNYAYLSLVALALLFISWYGVSAKRALLRGYLFGLGLFGLGISWVYISVHDFGGGGLIGSGLLTVLVVAFWAIFPALAGAISATIPANKPWLWIMHCALLWVLAEYLRGYLVLNGFPWFLSAYSQLDTPLSGYIPILGAYGSGFLLALSASGIAGMILFKKHVAVLITILIGIWLGGGLLQRHNWTTPIGRPFQVSMIQGNISQDQKWRPENRLNTLLTYKSLTEAHWDSQVIIWPESAIPAYLDEVYENFLLPLHDAAKQQQRDLIISVPIHDQVQDKKYNAVITLGNSAGSYRKNHLLPFGEYLPLQPLSGLVLRLFNMRLGNFQPGGDQQPLLQAGGYPFSTSICYEDAFGIKIPANAAYLVNVTNDAWFGDSIEPHQHLQIARMRALESGRFLLRATNTGITAIIAADGQVVQQAPLFTTTVLTGTVNAMTGSTPYSKLGDNLIVLSLAMVYLCLLSYQLFSHYPTKRPTT
ncbi:MAG: apolipoprotein N-acyltransferase [Methylococcales bacterium]